MSGKTNMNVGKVWENFAQDHRLGQPRNAKTSSIPERIGIGIAPTGMHPTLFLRDASSDKLRSFIFVLDEPQGPCCS
jgi:hypothetical protein